MLRAVILASSLLVACGDDGGGGDAGDAGTDVGGDDGVAEPMPPAPAMLTPCPPGAVEMVRDGAPTECWPITEPACADGEVRLFGDAECGPVGGPCEGDFPPGPASGAVYVRAGSTGGDGSEASPFATIGQALAAAGRGATVLVGRGTYEELLFVSRDVDIRGLCPAETILTTTLPDTINGVLNVTGATVTVSGLSVRGAPRGGIVATTRANATLRDVVVDDVAVFGVYVDLESTASIDELVVTGVADTADGQFGDGLVVDTAATATASRVLIERTHTTAINVLGAASLTIDGFVARDIEPNGAGIGGRALSVKAMGTVSASHVFTERAHETAVEVRDEGTSATLADLVLDDTRLGADGQHGRALDVLPGTDVSLRRMLVRGAGDSAILLRDANVEMQDVVVREVRGGADGAFGRFLELLEGGSLIARRVHFEDAKDIGLSFADEGTNATIEDLVIMGVQGRVSDGAFGRGLNAQLGAAVEAHRVVVRGVRNTGVFIDGASLTGEDLDVSEVTTSDDTHHGRGMNLQFAAQVTLARTRITDAFDLGLFAGGTGTTAHLSDLTIRRITAPRCPSGETCDGQIGGIGLGAYEGAVVEVDGIDQGDAALCGLHVADAAQLDIHGGWIRNNLIGACIQIDGYDVSRVGTPQYVDNETNLEATSLPVPSVDVGLDG